MKKILSILLFGALLTSCNNEIVPAEPRQVLIMYMSADNNLYGFLNENVNQMVRSITSSNLKRNQRILVLFDGGEGNTTLREVEHPKLNGKASLVTLIKYDNFNSSNPADMKKLLEDILLFAPADHYGIIMSSHGTGWVPNNLSTTEHKAPAAGGAAAPAIAEHDLSPLMNGMTRSFGWDANGSIKAMSVSDIVEGLSPIHFDFVMFDACLMSSVEVLYAMRNSADYVIASPVEIMEAGFPYQTVTPYFFNQQKPLEQRLKDVAQAFVTHYNQADLSLVGERSAAIAIIKMSEMERFAAAVRKIYTSGTNNAVQPFDVKPLECLQSHVFFDLNDYLSKLTGNSVLYGEYLEQYNRTVIFNDHTAQIFGGGYFSAAGICGLNTYIIHDTKPIFAAAWRETEWAKRVSD